MKIARLGMLQGRISPRIHTTIGQTNFAFLYLRTLRKCVRAGATVGEATNQQGTLLGRDNIPGWCPPTFADIA